MLKTNQEAVSSVMLPDGKFVVVGKGENIEEEIVIARYLPNGQLDNTFGEEGKTTFTPAGLTNDDLFDIYEAVLDYEGNLLIVGWLSSKTVLLLRIFLSLPLHYKPASNALK